MISINYLVLDPITMTPMLSGSGNITVNPLGVPSNFMILNFYSAPRE